MQASLFLVCFEAVGFKRDVDAAGCLAYVFAVRPDACCGGKTWRSMSRSDRDQEPAGCAAR